MSRDIISPGLVKAINEAIEKVPLPQRVATVKGFFRKVEKHEVAAVGFHDLRVRQDSIYYTGNPRICLKEGLIIAQAIPRWRGLVPDNGRSREIIHTGIRPVPLSREEFEALGGKSYSEIALYWGTDQEKLWLKLTFPALYEPPFVNALPG